MQAKQPRSTGMVLTTSPPFRTRTQCLPGTLATQTAPSASAQMPSGACSSSAQTRRSESVASAATGEGHKLFERTSQPPPASGPASSNAMPLGNWRSSATFTTAGHRVEPTRRFRVLRLRMCCRLRRPRFWLNGVEPRLVRSATASSVPSGCLAQQQSHAAHRPQATTPPDASRC